MTRPVCKTGGEVAIILKQNSAVHFSVSQWYLPENHCCSCWKLTAIKDKINEFKGSTTGNAKERNEHTVFNETHTQQHDSIQNSYSDCEPCLPDK